MDRQMTEQKKIFLQAEGNAWFNRNKQALTETSSLLLHKL